METRQALRQLRLFADALSPAQLDDFAARCRLRFFRAGSPLMHQGDFGSSMYGILTGSASVTFVDRTDREKEVATLTAGDVAGEMAMLTGDRRSATVTAIANVDALEITRPALEKLFARAPELMDAFAASLAARQAQLDQLAAEHAQAAHHRIFGHIKKMFGQKSESSDARA